MSGLSAGPILRAVRYVGWDSVKGTITTVAVTNDVVGYRDAPMGISGKGRRVVAVHALRTHGRYEFTLQARSYHGWFVGLASLEPSRRPQAGDTIVVRYNGVDPSENLLPESMPWWDWIGIITGVALTIAGIWWMRLPQRGPTHP